MDRKLWEAEYENTVHGKKNGNEYENKNQNNEENSIIENDLNDEESNNHVLDEQELSRTIEELCLSKAEEFRMLGYNHVTGHEIWQCISKKYHKDGIPNLHKIVNDILTLKVTNFMNWLTMNAYKE
ncbi:post-transcriptional regulator [Chengkuizengella sediminis]|uniref:post-transcriptional regulator n=1 Tax=Chengkuizengella sediminis TaxID=1885917 RepID=UPI00196A41C1